MTLPTKPEAHNVSQRISEEDPATANSLSNAIQIAIILNNYGVIISAISKKTYITKTDYIPGFDVERSTVEMRCNWCSLVLVFHSF